ncbi:cytochrome d ubiquinol oxidase subunit II [Saccharomonospora sp. CUA-673]|uniref:cytochrome d ubiquinol oxidase subunit II n=1 Tax=Saccharomonospora sp. CUA-673 TaxID=1904969 RepID=UPI00095B28C9|nr:cytochrome d ubiquinol oxidase subunit II [Saccharomonospora sp. CUA-673]OLT39035.1 cytochrome d ubiquinol oxidase subunit II [Saccharomonospora sp. CUA-673]
MELVLVWFVIIAFLWLGYLFLEGFDFGVGMLLPVLSRNDKERRVMINTIGPVWDGNEVWIIVAGGAMFAAFPAWYAGLFSAAYLPLLFVLLALIGRGVAFEYRGKIDSERWRRSWDKVIVIGSIVPPVGVGFILASTILGLPLDADGNRVGTPFEAFRWDTALGALALTGFSLLHGAVFIALKTDGDIRHRARRLAIGMFPFAILPLLAFAALVQLRHGSDWTLGTLAVTVGAVFVAWWRITVGREGQAFAALGVVITGAVVTLFGALYPDVLPSTLDTANSLTVEGASSGDYTLTVMTWVAAFGTPAVLVYQGWTYWVFRKRIRTSHIPPVHAPR